MKTKNILLTDAQSGKKFKYKFSAGINGTKTTYKGWQFYTLCFKKLKDNTFVRVGKSLIVNKNYIHIINLTNQELRLNGQNLRSEFRLKASKEALKELKALIEQEGEKA